MKVKKILKERIISPEQFKSLLEPCTSEELELMAQRVSQEHLKHFGKAVILYTPMYISNYCVNQCIYCSYNARNNIKRYQLSFSEIEAQAKKISETGLKHILVLTGESEIETPVEFIISAVKIIKKYFDSVSVEIYPLSQKDYERLIEAGVDGLTIYQEVYDREIYKIVHPYGPKADYEFRFGAPERGIKAGMYSVNIGVLLGLTNYKEEVYQLGIHLRTLQEKYPEVILSTSVPRIRPYIGQEFDVEEVDDRSLVQIILALKLFLPSIGITLSTRENAKFRENLLPIGVAKMSAGVSTAVGTEGDEQFTISDDRSVEEVIHMLKGMNYQPVLKDWVKI